MRWPSYILSLGGMLDLVSFLPYYLPIFFPSGAVAFRMFRVARISRQTVIVMVKRNGKVLIPNGNLVMQEGDKVIMYTQRHFSRAQHIEV